MPFATIEHTADVGIAASGHDAGTCLADAGQGLCALLTGLDDPRTLRPESVMHVEVEAPDLPALAVAFLSELLWRLESEDELWVGGGAQVTWHGNVWRATAGGNAVRFHAGRHGAGVEVKAVTYHQLVFQEERGRWHLRVFLDI